MTELRWSLPFVLLINKVNRQFYFLLLRTQCPNERQMCCELYPTWATWSLPVVKLHYGRVCPHICKNLCHGGYTCWPRKESTWPNPDLSCTCAAPKAVGLHPGSARGLMRSCMIANNVNGTLENEQTTVPCFAVQSALQHLFYFIIFWKKTQIFFTRELINNSPYSLKKF